MKQILQKKKGGKQLLLMDESLRKAFNANFGGLKHCRTKRNNTSKSLYWASSFPVKQRELERKEWDRKEISNGQHLCIHICGIQKKQWQRKTGQDSLGGIVWNGTSKRRKRESEGNEIILRDKESLEVACSRKVWTWSKIL